MSTVLLSRADNFNVSDSVMVKSVSLSPYQYRMMIAGNLFTPKNVSGRAPAIIVGHSFGAVKEQSANLYATKMAELGFVTVSVDAPFFGSSEGEPRNAVLPELSTEAFSAAVDFLGKQETVNREKIGAIGVCGNGAFAISAAKVDSRIKAVAGTQNNSFGSINCTGKRDLAELARVCLFAKNEQQRTRRNRFDVVERVKVQELYHARERDVSCQGRH